MALQDRDYMKERARKTWDEHLDEHGVPKEGEWTKATYTGLRAVGSGFGLAVSAGIFIVVLVLLVLLGPLGWIAAAGLLILLVALLREEMRRG